MRVSALIAALLLGCGAATPPETASETLSETLIEEVDLSALPGDSIYNLQAELVDQDGAQQALSVYAGHPVLISMFYASCPSACPMLIGDIQAIEAELTASERAQLRVLLVSLDPASDTPAMLSEVVDRHHLDGSRWRLTSPSPSQVREIAAVLGISYQSIEGGELHHSSIITLLSPSGRPVAQLDGLRQSPEPLLAALRGG